MRKVRKGRREWEGFASKAVEGRTAKTEVQIRLRVDDTEVGGSGTAGTGIVSEDEVEVEVVYNLQKTRQAT